MRMYLCLYVGMQRLQCVCMYVCMYVCTYVCMWEFPKIRVPYFGVLIVRILLFRVLY